MVNPEKLEAERVQSDAETPSFPICQVPGKKVPLTIFIHLSMNYFLISLSFLIYFFLKLLSPSVFLFLSFIFLFLYSFSWFNFLLFRGARS